MSCFFLVVLHIRIIFTCDSNDVNSFNVTVC